MGPLHETFVSELMTKRNYGDATIRTLIILSGTRDPKSQPFLYTAKSEIECDRRRTYQQVEAWKALRRVLTYVTRGHRTCLGFVEPTIAIQG